MWITSLSYIKHPRWSAACILIVPVIAALLGCGPVIETTARDRQLSPVEGMSIERISILLDTSRLERTAETLDPARLKEKLEEELGSSGVFRQYRVEIADAPPASEPGRTAVAFTQLEYVTQNIRFPPAPPLGLACLYPVAAPVLFERDYLKLEVTIQAELLVYNRYGAVAGRTYLTESASGRANFFASGEKKAAAELQDIAYRNFSGQLIREFLFLTR